MDHWEILVPWSYCWEDMGLFKSLLGHVDLFESLMGRFGFRWVIAVEIKSRLVNNIFFFLKTAIKFDRK